MSLERRLLEQHTEFLHLPLRLKLRLLRTVLFPSCAYMSWRYGPCPTCRCWKLHLKRWRILLRAAFRRLNARTS